MSVIAPVLAALLAMQSASAPSAGDPARVGDVVVSASRETDHVRSFIDNIALPERNLATARFLDRVCVGVVNLRADAAQLVADRVSDVAYAVGLMPGEPGCSPNILVIATGDGAGLARAMVSRRRQAFLPGGSGMVRTRAALSAFQNGEAPIRWWHVAMPVDAHTGNRAVALQGEDPPVVRGGASRLRTELRHDIQRVIVIVDLSKLDGLHMGQVADYVAMISLSQVDGDGDFSGYDSVLSLLADNRDIEGLTDWDMAYLTALYAAELNQVNKSHQQGEIARLMAAARQPESADPAR